MACLYRPAGAIVPLGGGTGVIGGWAFTAELVQAPALLCAFIIKGFCKLTALILFLSCTLGEI